MRRALKYLLLVVGAAIFAYPFLWMIAGSLKPELEITDLNPYSEHFSLTSYAQVLIKIPIARAFLNSMIVSLSATASVVLFGSMVGYSLSKLRFPGSKTLYTLILFTMTIPFQ
ncbi:MAG TPA: carbohydrate ABC transporter permease, partial [Bacteroidota bacterium]|nr:carbohydrate ABC transporter permease [Bacteroidota bacterium]